MALPRSTRRTAFLGLSLVSLSAGCEFQPRSAEMHYTLNPASVTQLEEVGAPKAVQNQILSTLDLFFGTPSDPRLMVPADWVDEGFDPNYPRDPEDEQGSGEFTEEDLERIYADNEFRFRRELAAIADGDFEAIGPIKAAPVLNENLEFLRASHLAGEMDEEELEEEASLTLIEYYPRLVDSTELYRQQCLHCHGVEGGGDGPTSAFLDPLPRDYRKGVFKFTALKNKARPRRADLMRVLTEGVYGTAMPSFKRFSEAQLQGLVDYVRLLSIRGEMEHQLVATYLEEESLPIETALEIYLDIWSKWSEADESVVTFDGEVPRHATEAMLARGKELFNDATTGNCASCHGEQGRGDGASAYTENEEGELVSAYQDDWGHDILPRNITQGIFRGGGRPIDVYHRIYSGINGTPMPALGESKDANGDPLLDSDDMWALVHYVISLSENPRVAHHDPGSSSHDEPSEH